jgi:hypothetical protein
MAAPRRLVTLSAFARILDRKPSYVTELKGAGRLVLDESGKVDVDASLALIRETADPAKDGVRARHAANRGQGQGVAAVGADDADDGADAPAEFEPQSNDAKRRAKALADGAEADARKKLRDEQVELGQLLQADDVEHALRGAVATLRNGLENLPTILAPQVAAESDEAKCRVLITDAVEHALEELARQFSAIGKVEVA